MAQAIKISRATAERIASVWDEATSLSDAMERAGIKTKDARNQRRHRRAVERMLDITLEPHNPQHAEQEIDCPSYLDPKEAKKHKAFAALWSKLTTFDVVHPRR